MARRFVRVDLSSTARDFRPIAVEPGLPLLDKLGANTKLLYRWLGRMLADPEWDGEWVNYFVRDDHDGRLEEVECQPATRSDLSDCVADELKTLRERMDRVRPETGTERAIYKVLSRTFHEMVDDPHRTDLDDYFFRYRDVQDRWRLVWCWGYQRVDQETAPAVVCSDPECNLLFVRRPQASQKCPSCEAGLTPRKPRDWKKPALAALLLLLLVGLLGYWVFGRRHLVVTPWTWSGPAGSRIDFRVTEKGWFHAKDVTGHVATVTQDPRIVRLDRYGAGAVAAAPGETTVQFYLGKLSAAVNLKVDPAKAPAKLSIEPASVDFGAGTTAHLKLIGEYDDGTQADLSDVAQWSAKNDGIAFLCGGLLEGMGEGATTVTARYRPGAEGNFLEAAATVSVRKMEFQSLEIGLSPLPVGVGRASSLEVNAVTADGKKFSVLDSSLLSVSVEPSQVAQLAGRRVRGESDGQATIKASLGDQASAEQAFVVGNVPPVRDLVVLPRELEMFVNEIVDLSIAAPTTEPIKITSSDPKIVEVTDTNRLVGRSVGEAQLEVSQGDRSVAVQVTVGQAAIQSIAMDPGRVGVPVDDTVPVRVLGATDRGRLMEIAPDRLTPEKTPSPRFAEFDPRSMLVRGMAPTDPKRPQTLALSFAKQRAEGPVDVILPPLRLELTPAGTLEVPLGQRAKLQGWAVYHGTHRSEVPADRIQWHTHPAADPAKGIEVKGGYASAWKAQGGPIDVWGTYFGRDSNRVAVKAVEAAPVTLHLEPDPSTLGLGEAGTARLSGVGPESSVDLVPELAQFSSSDPNVLKIDEHSGAYRALAPGEVVVTAKHPAAKDAVTGKVAVVAAAPVKRDLPVAVRILSDQGPAVRFPVGAEFDDFRVEAEYAEGTTRLVTRRATLRTTQSAEQAPLTASRGRLIGVRPGQTTVQAEFDGVHSKQGLDATVTADVDIDQLFVRPAPATILPGETVTLDAVGYKDGKSCGILTGFGKMAWKSADEQIVRLQGPAVTGVKLGATTVTAQLGSVASKPAEVSVVESIAEGLSIDPRRIQLVVGESRQVGSDIIISRGDLDLSRQCSVASSSPGVVHYNSDTRALVGVSPGTAAVAFAWGEKTTTVTVEVVPAGRAISGEVLVEPAAGTLAPGQAVDMRVYVIDREGRRYDRTESAVLTSSDPSKIRVVGNRALAVAPGSAAIAATVSGSDATGKAYLSVGDGKLSDVFVEPSSLLLGVGERADLRIMGRSDGGTHELVAQSGLATKVGGPNPGAIRIAGGNQVEGVTPGQAEVTVAWNGQVLRTVPVTVTNDRLTDLQIAPSPSTIEVGDRVVYSVTAMRGGRRQVLGPDDGVQLSVTQPDVGQVVDGLGVRGLSPGHTTVIAQYAGQQAEASLTVASEGSQVVLRDGRGVIVEGRVHGHRRRRVVIGDRDVVYEGPGATVVNAPRGQAVDLQFSPDVLRLPLGSSGAGVRVLEVLADGTFGRDVSDDPNLEISKPEGVATLERTPAGPIFKPERAGETRVAAKLGTLTTVGPLLIQVGDVAADAARLVVAPNALALAPGETGALRVVMIDPGAGQAAFEADYRLSIREGQGVVSLEGKRIHAQGPGEAIVEVTPADDKGPYAGLSTVVPVEVGGTERVWIEPGDVSLQVGQQTPRFSVLAAGEGGAPHEVAVSVESVDPNVLAPDAEAPGRFVAKDYGGTQVRAVYRGREALANVTVSGARFTAVNTTLNEGDKDFDVTIEVLGAAAEGPLEYRVYADGQPPSAAWQASEPAGDEMRRVVLRSPRMPYAGRSAQYRLIIEARDPGGKSVQQYPFTFRLVPKLERTDPKK